MSACIKLQPSYTVEQPFVSSAGDSQVLRRSHLALARIAGSQAVASPALQMPAYELSKLAMFVLSLAMAANGVAILAHVWANLAMVR
jgi:hypothetical protein